MTIQATNNYDNDDGNDSDNAPDSLPQQQQQPPFALLLLWNEVNDMWRQMDNVVDDFFNKRMGNGQVFYGQRKYKPSDDQQYGQYNGMGYTDKSKIEYAKFRKEQQQPQLGNIIRRDEE
jgi:hypothetical protein